MKHLLLIAASAVLLLFTSSCGTTSWMTSNQNQNQTSVVLSDNNFKIVKTVSATVSSTYVFGIGGLSDRTLMANVMNELTEKADLTGSQALINVTYKVNNEMILLLWTRKTVLASGTVIEFIDK